MKNKKRIICKACKSNKVYTAYTRIMRAGGAHPVCDYCRYVKDRIKSIEKGIVKGDGKARNCLKCSGVFESRGVNNRLCQTCKSSEMFNELKTFGEVHALLA